MTWALAGGYPVIEAFAYGIAAGAAAAMTPGTELCRQADVLHLFKQVCAQFPGKAGTLP